MLLQPRAFAYLSHPEHVNKDLFELFTLACSWVNSDDVRIKPGKYQRQSPGGRGGKAGINVGTCSG